MHGALLLRLTLFAAGAAIALVALVRYIEPRLTFFPVAGETATPAQSGVPCESETIVTADGERLRAWTMARADARATILYFHGNGGNLSIWAPILAGVQRHGYAVHTLDYRGYGESTGRPSERGLYRDVDAALEWFHAAYGSRKCPSVYWGRSMGTTMAAYAAARRRPDGLILESGFPDARSLLRGFLPFKLLGLFSTYRFPTASYVQASHCPVLVLHGDRDRIVPFELGQALFEAVPQPKQFVRIAGGDHNDLEPADAETYWPAVHAFVDRLG
ncbi:MAG TPA: alpha/beta hydrolase [Vicinamibacterales bacterium]|nr:alpha/beta hydrolase [Vicinamibacterales bacterium]